MASLQARSPFRSAHPLLLLVNKFVSLALFIALLCIGWVALNYLRTELMDRWHNPATRAVSPAPNQAAVLNQSAEGKEQPAVVAPRLVYFCSSDSEYYHASTHIGHCKRTALSEEAAITRGLRRCPVCLPK